MSEAIQNEHIRGFRGGFSIPLWQKRNTIKAAKISLDLNMAQQDYALQRREASWDQQFELYKSKSERLNSLGKLLDKTTPHKSLLKAFELGEISLRTYITESVFYYQSEDNYLQLEMEMNRALSKLYIVEICSRFQ